MQVDLKWFHEMSWSEWEVFAEKDSTTSSTPHLNCRGDCDIDQYSKFYQMQTLSAQESLTQLEIALRPSKEKLVRSCITYAKHMEESANYSVGIQSELSKTLSNLNQDSELEIRRRLSGQVERTITSVVTVMGLAYLWLADSLDEDSLANSQLSQSLYSPVTGRSLVCVPNSSCVVRTVTSRSSRLSDSSWGCPLVLSIKGSQED